MESVLAIRAPDEKLTNGLQEKRVKLFTIVMAPRADGSQPQLSLNKLSSWYSKPIIRHNQYEFRF